ncbi:hypothetical protein HNY73_008112 [Argiope bruennichi]|uniref:Uncharacterized protein n=1 Tax=Argiope bruennichi TaxID=94029 RepID=A0A8T0F6A2_ARGBR|nr:hypothetical protein HNY73_008112 [Argiope bruennichi]
MQLFLRGGMALSGPDCFGAARPGTIHVIAVFCSRRALDCFFRFLPLSSWCNAAFPACDMALSGPDCFGATRSDTIHVIAIFLFAACPGRFFSTENASIRPFAALLTRRAQTQDGDPDYKKLYEAAKRKSAAERSRADFWKGQYIKLRERLGPQQQVPAQRRPAEEVSDPAPLPLPKRPRPSAPPQPPPPPVSLSFLLF